MYNYWIGETWRKYSNSRWRCPWKVLEFCCHKGVAMLTYGLCWVQQRDSVMLALCRVLWGAIVSCLQSDIASDQRSHVADSPASLPAVLRRQYRPVCRWVVRCWLAVVLCTISLHAFGRQYL